MELTLGTKITLLRKFSGIQQKELAAELGIKNANLSDYEADKHVPGIDVLSKIAKVCEMHPSYFFDNIPPTKFYQVLEDLKYAYYLSCLPDQVRRYQRELLKRAYEFNAIEEKSASIGLLQEKPKRTESLPHQDYFDFIRKKETIEGDIESFR